MFYITKGGKKAWGELDIKYTFMSFISFAFALSSSAIISSEEYRFDQNKIATNTRK